MSSDYVLGSQSPTFSNVPEGDKERGEQAVLFARAIGMTLYPWQENVLRDMCRTKEVNTPQGTQERFSSRRCVLVVPRQNGKNEIMVARELAGIFLFGEKIILHTAQLTQTATAAMQRTRDIIQNNENLMEWWSETHNGSIRFSRTNGKEEITFPSGQMIKFNTRSNNAGRGLTVDLLVIDEALEYTPSEAAALENTTMAVENAQSVFMSSPVDMYENPNGKIFSDLRWQGFDGADGIYYAEWTAEENDDIYSQETWAKANPSLVESGFGVQIDQIRQFAESAKYSESSRDKFSIENLGLGHWFPRDTDEVEEEHLFDGKTIEGILTDKTVKISRPVIAIDAHPERENVAISLGGKRKDGQGFHIKQVFFDALDTKNTMKIIMQAIESVDPEMILVDKKNPAGMLFTPLLQKADFDVKELNLSDIQSATALFMQLVDEKSISISRDEVMEKALQDIKLRAKTAGICFERYSGDVAGLVAGAMAVYACNTLLESPVKVIPKKKAQNRIVKRGDAGQWRSKSRRRRL